VTDLNIGPDELVRIAFVAHQHYIVGRTRIQIAQDLGLSRFKVGRMLDDAIAGGIVKFEISTPGPLDLELSLKLKDRFGLKHALAVRTPTEAPETVQEHLGAVAAELLREIATDEDVIGLTAGRTLSAMAGALTTLPHCDVVQLAGVAGPIQETGVEVIRRVSSVAGGRPWSIYAPLVVSDPKTAQAIRQQPDMQATFAQFARVTIALVAVGSWSPPDSQMYDNAAISPARRGSLLEKDVRAEVCATLIDGRGNVVEDIEDSCIAIDTAALRRIPDVIAVAGGEYKTSAIRAALASGLVNSLITDSALAKRLIGE
jgi:DNA-binding transcriptional regulator LsrR (DeoR family)